MNKIILPRFDVVENDVQLKVVGNKYERPATIDDLCELVGSLMDEELDELSDAIRNAQDARTDNSILDLEFDEVSDEEHPDDRFMRENSEEYAKQSGPAFCVVYQEEINALITTYADADAEEALVDLRERFWSEDWKNTEKPVNTEKRIACQCGDCGEMGYYGGCDCVNTKKDDLDLSF